MELKRFPMKEVATFFEINVLSGIRLRSVEFAKDETKELGRIVFISSESGIQTPPE